MGAEQQGGSLTPVWNPSQQGKKLIPHTAAPLGSEGRASLHGSSTAGHVLPPPLTKGTVWCQTGWECRVRTCLGLAQEGSFIPLPSHRFCKVCGNFTSLKFPPLCPAWLALVSKGRHTCIHHRGDQRHLPSSNKARTILTGQNSPKVSVCFAISAVGPATSSSQMPCIQKCSGELVAPCTQGTTCGCWKQVIRVKADQGERWITGRFAYPDLRCVLMIRFGRQCITKTDLMHKSRGMKIWAAWVHLAQGSAQILTSKTDTTALLCY